MVNAEVFIFISIDVKAESPEDIFGTNGWPPENNRSDFEGGTVWTGLFCCDSFEVLEREDRRRVFDAGVVRNEPKRGGIDLSEGVFS